MVLPEWHRQIMCTKGVCVTGGYKPHNGLERGWRIDGWKWKMEKIISSNVTAIFQSKEM